MRQRLSLPVVLAVLTGCTSNTSIDDLEAPIVSGVIGRPLEAQPLDPVTMRATWGAPTACGSPTRWAWQFDADATLVDGGTTSETPTIRYTSEGDHPVTVTLTWSCQGETREATETYYYRVFPPGDFVIQQVFPTRAEPGETLAFSAYAVGTLGETIAWSWTFDGGASPTSSNADNPSVTVPSGFGTFGGTVRATASGSGRIRERPFTYLVGVGGALGVTQVEFSRRDTDKLAFKVWTSGDRADEPQRCSWTFAAGTVPETSDECQPVVTVPFDQDFTGSVIVHLLDESQQVETPPYPFTYRRGSPVPIHVVSIEPTGTVGTVGETVTFTAEMVGSCPAGFQNDYSCKDLNWVMPGRTLYGNPSGAFLLDEAGTFDATVDLVYVEDDTPFAFQYTVAPAGSLPSITQIYAPAQPRTGETGQFSAIVSGDVTTYTWNMGGGATPNSTQDPMPTVTFGAPGDYEVGLLVFNEFGASEPFLLPYTVLPAITDPPDIYICSSSGYFGASGDTINFNCSANFAGGATWSYDFGTGASVTGPIEQFTQITLGSAGAHVGSVTAATAAGSDTFTFTFLVTDTPVVVPSFTRITLTPGNASVRPRLVTLADGRPMAVFVDADGDVAASVASTAAPAGAADFDEHEIDTAPPVAPVTLAAAVAGLPAVAYAVPSGSDLELWIALSSAAGPDATADWTAHRAVTLTGVTNADIELGTAGGSLAIAATSTRGVELVVAQSATPTSSSDWAMHTVNASTTISDADLRETADGTWITFIDTGVVYLAAATGVPDATADWTAHTIASTDGVTHVSIASMASGLVVAATRTTIFDDLWVYQASSATPSQTSDWTATEVSGSGRNACDLVVIAGRPSVVSGSGFGQPRLVRSILPDVTIMEAWQSTLLPPAATSLLVGDAIGLNSGVMALVFSDAASGGTVIYAQGNAVW